MIGGPFGVSEPGPQNTSMLGARRVKTPGANSRSTGAVAAPSIASTTRWFARTSRRSKLPGRMRNATRTGQPSSDLGRRRIEPLDGADCRSTTRVLRFQYCGIATGGAAPSPLASNTSSSTAWGGAALAPKGHSRDGRPEQAARKTRGTKTRTTRRDPLSKPALDSTRFSRDGDRSSRTAACTNLCVPYARLIVPAPSPAGDRTPCSPFSHST